MGARIAILGNSGSGKSTLAAELAARHCCRSLDLDTIYWEADAPGVPRDIDAAARDLARFCEASDSWVIEGCYETLIERALVYEPELIFLDPGVERCLANCRARPWEPHKYASPDEQNARLPMLLGWVADYYTRAGEMSHASHRALFEAYSGPKRRAP